MTTIARFGLSCLFGVLAICLTAPALAAPRDEWATVTHAGNAPYVYQDFDLTVELGRVDYDYQIRKTEVTAFEWFEFVQAYAPYVPANERISSAFTSPEVGIYYNPDNTVGYYLHHEAVNLAVEVSWRYAARFCNWLHNGKATTREAFDQGVYDTSTFGQNEQGLSTDSSARSPDASYWLPSEDEWVKAAYFDPNRFGPDQPGYWRYPNRSDVPLIEGLPGVGQTNAALTYTFDVASYFDQTSPWGLWDLSGGEREWLDSVPQGHPMRGSYSLPPSYSVIYDHIENPTTIVQFPYSMSGFRLARPVPVPSPACCVALLALHFIRRRKR